MEKNKIEYNPKFHIGNKVYYIDNTKKKIIELKIERIVLVEDKEESYYLYYYGYEYDDYIVDNDVEKYCFLNKKDAEKKLEELKKEKKNNKLEQVKKNYEKTKQEYEKYFANIKVVK